MKPHEIIADQMDFLFNAGKRLAEKEKREARFADDIENGTPITITRI